MFKRPRLKTLLAIGAAGAALLGSVAVPAQDGRAAPPVTLEAAERAYGLARSSDQLGYLTREATAEAITYSGITLAGGLRARQMVLSLGTGALAGKPVARLTGLSGPDASAQSGLLIDMVELTGIDPRLVNPDRFSPQALRSGDIGLRGDVRLEGFSMREGTNAMLVERFAVLGLEPGSGMPRFARLDLSGARLTADGVSANLANLTIRGINEAGFESLGRMLAGQGGQVGDLWKRARIDEVSVRGIEVQAALPAMGRTASLDPRELAVALLSDIQMALAPAPVLLAQASRADAPPPPPARRGARTAPATIKLGEFTVRDLGMLDRTDFVLAGMSLEQPAQAGADNAMSFAMDRFAVEDLSMPLMLASLGPDLTPLSAEQLASPLLSRPSDGPLGFAATGFAFGGMRFDAMGARFTMDPMIATFRRDASGQIVAWEMPGGRISFNMPGPPAGASAAPATGGTSPATGTPPITSFSASWTPMQGAWDPATDVATASGVGMTITDMFSVTLEMASGGSGAWVRTRTLKDIADYAKASMASAGQPEPQAMIPALLKLYDGLTLVRARATVTDLGGLATWIREAAVPADGTDLAPARSRRLESVNAMIADKSQPGIIRILARGLRGFVQRGGTMDMGLAPAQPVPYARMAATDLRSSEIGYTVSYR